VELFGINNTFVNAARPDLRKKSRESTRNPINEVSKSQLNKREREFGAEIAKQIESIAHEKKLTTTEGELGFTPKLIQGTDNQGKLITYIYENPDKSTIDAIVRGNDESFIPRASYHREASLQPNMVHPHLIEKGKQDITNSINEQVQIRSNSLKKLTMEHYARLKTIYAEIEKKNALYKAVTSQERRTSKKSKKLRKIPEAWDRGTECEAGSVTVLDENCNIGSTADIEVDEEDVELFVYRNVVEIFQVVILKMREDNIVNIGDKLFVKLGGDGRQVGRQVKHTMITICILNEGDNVLKPDHQYAVSLQVGQEKYEYLAATLYNLNLELTELEKNGFKDSLDQHWSVELFVSADWKFLALVLGINGPTANYFCFYDNCHKSEIHDMKKVWTVQKTMADIIDNYSVIDGHQNPCILTSIPLKNWILDELHLMLRITDILFETLWERLTIERSFENILLPKLTSEFHRISVNIHFFCNEHSGNKWQWTSLMGPAKLKVLRNFNLKYVNFFSLSMYFKGFNLKFSFPL